MKRIGIYIGVILGVMAIAGLVGAVVGYTLHGSVFFTGKIVDELEDVDIFADADCTIPAMSADIGDINVNSQKKKDLYLKNISFTRSTLVRAVIEPDPDFPELYPDWAEPLGIVIAPTSITILPGQTVMFQVGVTAPVTAELEDIGWRVRFFSDEDMPPPAGIIYIPGSDARIDWGLW